MNRHMKTGIIGALLILMAIFICQSCEDDPVTPRPASKFYHHFPATADTNVSLLPELTWAYRDTDSDSLFFDLYFGHTTSPPLFDSLLVDTAYSLGVLAPLTTYYWQVIAYNKSGDSTASPLWHFNTKSTFRFPLKTGHTWNYNHKFIHTNLDPDTLTLPYPDTAYGSSTVEIEGLELVDTIETYAFHYTWTEGQSSGESRAYRNDNDSGLYAYAYDGEWVGPPKADRQAKIYFEFHGKRYASPSELIYDLTQSIYGASTKLPAQNIEDPPIREFAYPLDVGRFWIYRSISLGHVWNMARDVVDFENIISPAGAFDCFVIKWLWDTDGDEIWDTDFEGCDYLSPIGIIKRTFIVHDIFITDEYGHILGSCDIIEEYELQNYNLSE